MKLELKNVDDQGYPERTPIPDKSSFEAVLLSVEQQDSRWDLDDTDPSKGKKKELVFKFEIMDPDGEFNERWVWGRTTSAFTTHPSNKLRQWVQGILDEDVLPDGFVLDTTALVDRRCRVIVGAREKKTGGVGNFVTDVRPSKVPNTAFEQPGDSSGTADDHLAADIEPF